MNVHKSKDTNLVTEKGLEKTLHPKESRGDYIRKNKHKKLSKRILYKKVNSARR